MRERLFRGKRLDDGTWVEGYHIRASQSEAEAIIIPVSAFAEQNRNMRLEIDEYWAVDPATVRQDIGIDDKNGKKIFLGDLIKISDMRGVTTVTIDTDWLWIDVPRHEDGSTYGDISDYEVVGNIYDNPELLEGET